MNPTSNKKDFEDLTTNLKDLAYGYIEKYSPSKQQIKIYLLKKYLNPMVKENIDHLVLGCSHYPFLIPIIKKIIPENI